MKLTLSINQKAIESFTSKDKFRPLLHYVFFNSEKKELVAADGHYMLVYPCDTESFPSVLLPISAFPKKKDAYTELSEDGTVIEYDKKNNIIEKRIITFKTDESFPNYRNIFKEKEIVPIESIGFTMKLLENCSKFYNGACKFTFRGKSEAVVIEPINSEEVNWKIILMPIWTN